jgi:hypothetical protein
MVLGGLGDELVEGVIEFVNDVAIGTALENLQNLPPTRCNTSCQHSSEAGNI